MSATAPWWALLPPAEAEVSCGEQAHRVVWREGRLTATDHPDAEGELVLAALGGERSECVDLIESWGSRGDDLEVLAVGPRSAADELTITPDDVEVMPTGGGLFAFTTSRLVARGRPLAAVRPSLGMPWPRRLPRGAVSYGGDHGQMELQLAPALHPDATSLELTLVGPSGQVSVTVPLDWWEAT